MTVCVTCAAGQAPPPAAAAAVAGYVVLGTSVQRLPDGGIVVVHSLQAPDACAAATSVGTGQVDPRIHSWLFSMSCLLLSTDWLGALELQTPFNAPVPSAFFVLESERPSQQVPAALRWITFWARSSSLQG